MYREIYCDISVYTQIIVFAINKSVLFISSVLRRIYLAQRFL